MSAANWGIFGGGGGVLNIFFRCRKVHQEGEVFLLTVGAFCAYS